MKNLKGFPALTLKKGDLLIRVVPAKTSRPKKKSLI